MAAERARRTASEPAKSTSREPALDPLIHEQSRLGILSALAAVGRATFVELKESLALTDGNLSMHARRLESAGYISCEKSFAGRVPRTTYHLTALGRRALSKYLAHMEAIIRAARGSG